MSTGYAIAYRFGITPWERAGETDHEGFAALLDREQQDRPHPPGRALDLGCGRGLHTHQLARLGWDATGIDNIPRAIDAARTADDSGATFAVADVTALEPATLGRFDFFLDIGCLHGLTLDQRTAAARGITALANPGATLLLLAFQPHGMPLLPAGLTRADIESAFLGWQVLTVEVADTTGMPGPLKKTRPLWYRLRRVG